MILPVGIGTSPPARRPGRPADRLDLAPMDLPAHHPERPARGDAGPVGAPSERRSPVTDARPRPAFAHASEAELARILDFYEVAWEYEPHTFPILLRPRRRRRSRASARTSTCPSSTSTSSSRRSSSAWSGRRTASCGACASSTRTSGSSCSTRATSGRSSSSTAGSPWPTALSGAEGQSTPPRRDRARRRRGRPARRGTARRSVAAGSRPPRPAVAAAADAAAPTSRPRPRPPVSRAEARARAPPPSRRRPPPTRHGDDRMNRPPDLVARRRRGPPVRGRDPGQGGRARAAPDLGRLRRPRADPGERPEGLAAVHGRPHARDHHPGPDRPHGGLAPTAARPPSRPGWCASSRTSRRRSTAATCSSSRTSSTPG